MNKDSVTTEKSSFQSGTLLKVKSTTVKHLFLKTALVSCFFVAKSDQTITFFVKAFFRQTIRILTKAQTWEIIKVNIKIKG